MLGFTPQMVHLSDMNVVKVVYGEVMTQEELLQIMVRARRENATSLDLSGGKLTSLPDSIRQLTNLRILDLRNNQLKRLSEAVGQLTNLQELYLYDNQLTNLPVAIGQLQNLQILGLSDNRLIGLPTSIGQLANLKILFLSGNNLTRLPPFMGRLLNLVRLSLSENSLIELPVEIGQLVNLQRLDASFNQLIRLPESIGRITNLQFLDLSNNQLTLLPQAIDQLTHLQEINTSGNPLQGMLSKNAEPRILLTQQPKKLVSRMPPTREQSAAASLNEVKIIVLGQVNTGKTSLVKRLIHNQFTLNESATDGVSIEKWPIDFATVATNDPQQRERGCFHVWDFSGQESIHAVHQLCFTEQSLYLLVVDNNKSEEENRIEYWLQLIASCAKNSPIFIVGNKQDQASLNINYSNYQQKYVNLKGFFSVSCRDTKGVADLNRHILKEALILPSVRANLPPEWLTLKTKLENLNKGYITYAEYSQFCTECYVVAGSAQQDLLALLHNLGTILVFYRDQPLDDTAIFNPAWIMHGIYRIFNDHFLVSECKGILTEHMLTRILTPFQSNKREFTYTPTKHRFILETMVKLELCCQLSDQRSFLIPALLPPEELPAAQPDRWQGALQFRYCYAVFPHGLLWRLMVRCGELIDHDFYWRNGVILKSKDNQALIKSDRQEKTISLYISGLSHTRRDLLLMLRHEFAEIHQIFGIFEVDICVPLPDSPSVVIDYQQLLDSRAAGVEVIMPPGLRQQVNVCALLDTIDLPDVMAQQTVDGHGQTAQQVVTSIQKNGVIDHPDELFRGQLAAETNDFFVGQNSSYPAVSKEQLEEVHDIARRLVQGDLVDGEVDLLSAHLREPLADAIHHLLSLPAALPERANFQSVMIDDPFLD
jgi:internalin A